MITYRLSQGPRRGDGLAEVAVQRFMSINDGAAASAAACKWCVRDALGYSVEWLQLVRPRCCARV